MSTTGHPLDDPVLVSLTGPHAHLAQRHGAAVRYRPDVASFVAVPADAGERAWADLAALLGPGGLADLFSSTAQPPPDWAPVFAVDGLQLVAPASIGPAATDPEVVELGPGDLPEVLALVGETRPGPFWPRTVEMGTYLGLRDGDRLVAMAGERLHPPGWTEISAVCTAPSARGRGLAGRLVRALTARIAARDEGAFLHVVASNTGALDLYERLGFVVRREVVFRGFTVP
jgi:ribosomal protein S18 acetylase RimI-like enzyme